MTISNDLLKSFLDEIQSNTVYTLQLDKPYTLNDTSIDGVIIQGTTNNVGIVQKLSSYMLGPNTDFTPIQIDIQNPHYTLSAHLVSSATISDIIHLKLEIIKIQKL